jgi:hypothetical protein
MVLPKPIKTTSKPYFFVFTLVFALFMPTVLSFLPCNAKTTGVFHVSSPPQSVGHWRANRRIYPNQQASAKSAIEAPFNLHPPQVSVDRIFRVAQDRDAAVPSLNRCLPAVLFPVLRI